MHPCPVGDQALISLDRSWAPFDSCLAQDKLLAQNKTHKKSLTEKVRLKFCSSSWARTKDPLINSQML